MKNKTIVNLNKVPNKEQEDEENKSKDNFIVSSGKKTIGYEYIKNNTTSHLYVINSLLKLFKKVHNDEIEEEQETFRDYCHRMNIDKNKLITIYDNLKYSFYINLFMSFLLLISLLYSMFILKKTLIIFSAIGVLCIFISNMSYNSFKMYQIRKRRFLPFIDWLERQHEWMPKELTFKKRKKPIENKVENNNSIIINNDEKTNKAANDDNVE